MHRDGFFKFFTRRSEENEFLQQDSVAYSSNRPMLFWEWCTDCITMRLWNFSQYFIYLQGIAYQQRQY